MPVGRFVLAVTLRLLLCGQALAQIPGVGSSSATLPESNEAMLLASRAIEAGERGDYRLAIQVIERIMGLPDELTVDAKSGVYYPVWRQARRLLGDLPPDGIEYYRRMYDGEVDARFDRARRSGNIDALRELFRRYGMATSGVRIGQELATRLIEAGLNAEAVEVLREVQSILTAAHAPRVEAGFAAECEARLVVALTEIGASAAAQTVLGRLESLPDEPPRAAERRTILRRWFDARGGERDGAQGRAAYRPLLATARPWEQRLSRETEDADDDAALASAIQATRGFPLTRAVADGDALVVRLRGEVHVLDALTLTHRWRASEIGAAAPPAVDPAQGMRLASGGGDAADDEPALAPELRSLLRHPLRNAVSAAFGCVYTIESLSELDEADRRRYGRGPDAPASNELVCRRLATGEILWRRGRDETESLSGAAFQDAPLAVGPWLVAAVHKARELMLVAFEPRTGVVLQEVPIVGPPTLLPAAGGRCQVLADDVNIYVCTGNGVIAAIGSTDWRWRWAVRYPSETLAAWNPRPFFMGGSEPAVAEQPAASPPLVAGDLLVVSPADSAEVIAVDRFTGSIRWRAPRDENRHVAGVLADGLVLFGRAVSCVALSDGMTLRWRSVPLDITGRPDVRDGRVYVPTREELVALDGATGKIVGVGAGDAVIAGNLLAAPLGLVRVSSSRVRFYPDPEALEAGARRVAAAGGDGPRAALASAQLAASRGMLTEALEELDAMADADGAIAEARDALMASLFIALSNQLPAGQSKLAWLRKAQSMSAGPRVASRLPLLIGMAIEEDGSPRDALEHYRSLLLERVPSLLDDGPRRVAGWVHAAGRLRHVLARVSAAEQSAWCEELVTELTSGPMRTEVAIRAREALPSGAALDRLDLALLGAGLPPESTVTLLRPVPDTAAGEPNGSDPLYGELALDRRRRLHLERWSTHLALGLSERVAEDEAYWKQRLDPALGSESGAASQPTTEGAAEAEYVRQRLETLERVARKLPLDRVAQFDESFVPYWRAVEQKPQLVLDVRNMRCGGPRSVLTHCLETRRLALRHLIYGRLQPPDTDADIHAGRTSPVAAAIDADGEVGDHPSPWPGVYFGFRAVVPVEGGLVCVTTESAGLRADIRLWEYAIPDMASVASDFGERAAADGHGFYFAPRDDRVLAIDWLDGRLRWRRDLGGLRVQRLYCTGDKLMVVGRNGEVQIVDSQFGDPVRRLELPPRSVSAVAPCRGKVVVGTDRSIDAYELDGRGPVWTCRTEGPVGAWLMLEDAGWLLVRIAGRETWQALSVATGSPVLSAPLSDVGDLTSAALVGDNLLVAGSGEEAQRDLMRRVVRLTSIDTLSGAVRWRRKFITDVAVNVSQLAGHPELIPVLVATGAERLHNEAGRRVPVFVSLVRRDDGETVVQKELEAFRGEVGEATSAVVVVAPSRFVVQWGHMVAGYGNSRAGSNP